MSNETISTTLPQNVIDDELKVIRARRASAYPGNTQEGQLDNIANDLCGLSISGGGIRSSTFSIGVIQSLAKANLFKDFDYLSTVSGGGYTGSMLSTLLNNADESPGKFPLEMPVGDEEPKPLQHLRNGSNYLTPGGFLTLVRLPAVIIRGLILNFLILLPFIMATVFLTEILHEYVPVLNVYQFIATKDHWLYAFWILFGLSSYFLLSGWRSIRQNWSRRNGYELWIARTLLLVIALVLYGPFNAIVDWAIQAPWHFLEQIISDTFTQATWVIGTCVALIAFVVVKASENLSAIAGKLVFLVAALLGPSIVFGVYLLLVIAQVDSPFIIFDKPLYPGSHPAVGSVVRLRLDENQTQEFHDKDIAFEKTMTYKSVSVVAVYCGLDHWLFANPGSIHDRTPSKPDLKSEDCGISTDQLETNLLIQLRPRLVWPNADLYHSAAALEDRPNLIYEIRGARLSFGGARGPGALMDDSLFIGLTLLLFFLNYYFINVNQSSLHGFYRDRLSKLYLISRALNQDGKVLHRDDLKLSELNADKTSVPYHIINTTLNLQGDTRENQRGRDSDLFFFSKLYCGGSHTGYCDTKKMEASDRHLNLGTAMAISAAAASPNMGSTTIKSLIFILTLLNLRLGYWIPNPRFVAKGKYISNPWGRFLWREAVGKLTANSSLVNVSDGGHLENMALYELLRRRCKTIVCIDGEADEQHTFHGLITLIRIARIDLGIEIVIDLDDLRLDNTLCKNHFVEGKIIYGKGAEHGTLIYVKSSFTEGSSDNPFLRKFRAEYPSFPHQSTADQFFDERQFEAYRALGESVGNELVNEIRAGNISWPVTLSALDSEK